MDVFATETSAAVAAAVSVTNGRHMHLLTGGEKTWERHTFAFFILFPLK